MKVLIISSMYPRAMGGTFVHDQARHLMKAGCQLRVLVPTPYCPGIISNTDRWRKYADIPGSDTIDGVPVYYPRYLRLPGKWFHAPSCYTEYLGLKNIADEIIEDFKPEIIHAHAATVAGYIGLILKKKYNLPLICSIRGSDINVYPHYDRFSMHFTKKVISKSDRIVSVSRALKQNAEAISKPARGISVVYNGCDKGIFNTDREADRSHIRKVLAISNNDKALIFVGNIVREKGIIELIEAFSRIRLKMKGIHLIILGGDKKRNDAEITRALNNAGPSIHLAGKVPHQEVSRYLNAADFFVLPSYSEGLPNAVLEAMACNLPVIATRVGGIPEAVEDRKSGILIDGKIIPALVRSIEYLARHAAIAMRMGAYGKKIIESKFSWEHNARKMVEIYEGVHNGRF